MDYGSYPKSNAILVQRHGCYVWGPSWEKAKTQSECLHYLFEAAVKMEQAGLDPSAPPSGEKICRVFFRSAAVFVFFQRIRPSIDLDGQSEVGTVMPRYVPCIIAQ